MNSLTADLCKDHGITCVANEHSFRLGDGEVNEVFLQGDGIQLNEADTKQIGMQSGNWRSSPNPGQRLGDGK